MTKRPACIADGAFVCFAFASQVPQVAHTFARNGIESVGNVGLDHIVQRTPRKNERPTGLAGNARSVMNGLVLVKLLIPPKISSP